jgi:RHS repeat-associated protein
VSGTVAFGYDADLRLSGLAVDGDTIAYGYDDDGLLSAAGDLVFVRDSLNGLLSETSLDSVTTRTSYNTFGEPAADSAWVGSTLVFARTYARDDLGRITEVIDFADSVTTIWGYGYDEVGRLDAVTQDSVAYASYSYDANGNRLSRTSGAGTEVGTYDNQDRLLTYDGATYSYTPAGELLEKVEGTDTTRYDYDVLGNLIEIELPGGTLVEYTIDGRNRRIGRSVDGDLVQGLLYGDQLNPVAELDSLGNVVSRFVYGSKANVPDYIVQGSDTLRVISDHLGSVRLVVNASTGAVAQRVSYDAWGRVLEDTNPGLQPFGFAGGIWDGATGLVRFGARDYDAVAGRWTAKDPIGFHAGSPNLYGYAHHDPVNIVDPSGQIAPIVPVVMAGAAIGAVVNVGLTLAFSDAPITRQQLAAAIVSGALAGGAGALTGPAGGTIARALGSTSTRLLAKVSTTALSAGVGAVSQWVSNLIDPCHASSVLNAALFAGIGGAASTRFPSQGFQTLRQANNFGPGFGGLGRTPNSRGILGGLFTASGLGAGGLLGWPF